MHFEILIEDASGKALLDLLVPRILGSGHTWRIHAYRGLGHLPKDLRGKTDPRARILLDRLPKLLTGYAKSLDPDDSAVVVVVDADRRPCGQFLEQLKSVAESCGAPRTMFRLAIEEMEAWLLGDRAAVLAAYPGANRAKLDSYEQDTICGTWEHLADAIHPGGAAKLMSPGQAKSHWAARIGEHIDLERNASPSFRKFRDGIRRLAAS